MLDAYRLPGPVEPDLPVRCATPGEARCPHAGPPLGAACGDADPVRRLLPPRYARALSAAATAFLLMATASLGAVTYAVVESMVAHRRAVVPQAAHGWATSGGLGQGSHAVDELWRRAQELAEGGDVRLTRATLPRALAEGDASVGAIRVAPEPRKGGTVGLRVLAVGDRSAAALAGVREGDFIISVNGFHFGTPSDGVRAFTAARASQGLVAEILRDGKPVILRVDWG